jgi:hypothetical protein
MSVVFASLGRLYLLFVDMVLAVGPSPRALALASVIFVRAYGRSLALGLDDLAISVVFYYFLST